MHPLRELRADSATRLDHTAAVVSESLTADRTRGSLGVTQESTTGSSRPGTTLTQRASASSPGYDNSAPSRDMADRREGQDMAMRPKLRHKHRRDGEGEKQASPEASHKYEGNQSHENITKASGRKKEAEKTEERAEERMLGDEAVADSKDSAGTMKRAPPRERPKKQLSPVSARRARVEQQRRDQQVEGLSSHHPSLASGPRLRSLERRTCRLPCASQICQSPCDQHIVISR